jgi:hypothetical protein
MLNFFWKDGIEEWNGSFLTLMPALRVLAKDYREHQFFQTILNIDDE